MDMSQRMIVKLLDSEAIVAELHTLNELLATHFNHVDRPRYGWVDKSPYDEIMDELMEELREQAGEDPHSPEKA